MKPKHSILLLCILLSATCLYGQNILQESPAISDPFHRPGCPSTAAEANAEGLFNLSVPGYWNYDSSYFYQWIDPATTWYLYEKYMVQYNIAGYMTEGLYLEYDSVAGTWRNFTRYITNYNASNSIISRQGQAWNTATNDWVDFSLTLYDAAGRTTESFYRSFNRLTNEFTGGNRSLYVYDASGNTTEWSYQDWNTATSNWDYSFKGEYTYDADDFLTMYMQYTWVSTISDWQNSYRTTYTNNLNGDPVTEFTETWDENTTSWKNSEYIEYQYSVFNKLAQKYHQYWSSVTNGWENLRWFEFGYWGNQVRATEAYKQWNPTNSTWLDYQGANFDTSGNQLMYYFKSLDYSTYTFTGGYQYFYEYDENQRQVQSLNLSWNVTLGIWVDSWRRLTSYDPAGNMVLELDQVWDGSTWKDSFKMVHYYSERLGLPGLDPVTSHCLFNNPLKKGEKINCPGLDPSLRYEICLYSVNGKQIPGGEIQSGAGVTVPAGISTGIYILELRCQGRPVASGKVVITD